MKKFPGAVFFFVCLTLLFLAGCSTSDGSSKSPKLRVGLVEIDITPPAGHRMAGYFDERLATGTHDPLKAKAIVIQQGSEKIAFVFCDLVGITLHVSKMARAEASRKTGIPVTNILIAATHSHTGPLFDDVREKYFHEAAIAKYGSDPHEIVDYPVFLSERIVKAITQAESKLQPAELDVAIGKQSGISFNRRYHMKNGRVAFNPGQLNPNIIGPAGPIDPDVGMLLVRDAQQKLRGGLTIFAMHADTTGGTLYSADYPFYLQETLRGQLGKNYISAFAAGTCGDINHINVAVKESVKGPDVAKHLGTALGRTVLATLPDAEPIQKPMLAVRSKKISVPLQTVTPEQIADAKSKASKFGDPSADFFMKVAAVKTLDLAEKGPNWPMEVQVFRLDSDTAIVGLPCEIFVDLGLAIKAASPFKKTLVMEICNDRPSYVPTKKAFKEGSYEISNARVKPIAGEMLVKTAVRLLNEIKK